MTPIYGKLSDLYGRRLFYQIGIAIFLLGSVLSAMLFMIPNLSFQGALALLATVAVMVALAELCAHCPATEQAERLDELLADAAAR